MAAGSRRVDVYAVLDGEREYQESLNARTLEVGEEIALLAAYAQKALNVWAANFDDPAELAALCEIRKIAAIAVRCMEHHGAIGR